MFLQFRRSGWSRVFVVSTVTAITLAACGGGTEDKTAAAAAPASSVLAPTAMSQAARVKEIKSLTLVVASENLMTGVAGSSTQLSATALDTLGKPVVGALIRFSADELNFIGDTDVMTNEKGIATATVTSAGSKMNRLSEVYATAVGAAKDAPAIRSQFLISVSGTRIVTPASAPLHRFGITRIPVQLVDSDGVGVPGAFMDFTIEQGAGTDWAPETDMDGTVWLKVSNPTQQDNTIQVRVAGMSAEIPAPIEQIKPGDLSFRFDSDAQINTGLFDSTVSVLVHVQRADESPVAYTPISLSSSESGAISGQATLTDFNGDATFTVGAGTDLSNRNIDVTAEVLGATSKLIVPVRYTSLSIEVAPLMTNLAKPVWNIVAKDGLGKPIANADIDVDFSLLAAENSLQSTPIDPSTFSTTKVSTRKLRTDTSGKARIEFGALPGSLEGKVIEARGVYGLGKQTFSAKQHVYAGLLARDSQETILSDNIITETTGFRYDAKQWHRLFLTVPDVTLYESLNGKGPTGRDDLCVSAYTKITVRANGQDILLRGLKISSHTCDMEWSGDPFGWYGAGRTGFASSDFRVWYEASDNASLPAGRYIAPLRLSVIESEPESGNDIFWGNKDVVVFITK